MKWTSRWIKPGETADVEALRNQLQAEGFDVYQWKGTPGAAYLNYIHANDEVVCVLSGEAEAKVENQTGRVQSGDRLDIPANTDHSLTVTSDEPLVVLTGLRH